METSLARDLMSNEEWAFYERFILAIRAPNGRKPMSHRSVLDGVFWIARTGSPWRDLPEEFGKWSSVYRQFRRWTLAGLWEGILEALNESELVPAAMQMIESTVVRVTCHWSFIQPRPEPVAQLIRSPTLDRPKAEFSG